MTTWLGVDPGGAATGLALLRHDPGQRPVHLDHDVVLNPSGTVGHAYLGRVLAAAARLILVHLRMTSFRDAVQVAVETVNPPCGFVGGKRHPIDPAALIGCATVLGAVMATYPDAVLVPPGGNGRGAYASYPLELVTPGERLRTGWQTRPAGQGSDMRHARSAWDAAIRAHQMTTHAERTHR